MIEEILSDIRKAETEAAEIIAKAEARSEEIRAEAENRSAEISENAKTEAKNYRSAAIQSAEIENAKKTSAFAYETEKECRLLKENYKEKAHGLAVDIFRRIKDGNC